VIRPSFVFLIARRHLRDLFRERRTILGIVLVPLLVVLLFTFQRDELSSEIAAQAGATARIAVQGSANGPKLMQYLDAKKIVAKAVADAEAAVRARSADVALIIGDGFDQAVARGTHAELIMVTGNRSVKTQLLQSRVTETIDAYGKQVLVRRLERAGLPASAAEPVSLTPRDITTSRERTGNLLGEILPFMLLGQVAGLMSGVATDVTAGEKERRTVEALLASPLTRREIVAGKWLVTLAIGLIAGTVTLTSVVGSVLASSGGLSEAGSLPLAGIGAAAIGLVAAALFLSSVQIAIGFYARSVQQASIFLTPLIFIAFIPLFFFTTKAGGAVGLPWYAIPGLGPALLLRYGIAETARAGALPVTIIASIVYAAAGVALADRLLNSERALLRAGG
jgi:sodium transport system permease protein